MNGSSRIDLVCRVPLFQKTFNAGYVRSMKLIPVVLVASVLPILAENWPQWRGPRLDGTSAEKNIPVHWNATSNVVWKTALPGLGHASPIVYGNKIFTVSAVPETEERVLLCVDRTTGKIVWQKSVIKSPLEKKHALNSHASSTPACDGERVFVSFLDQAEMAVAAYDLDANSSG
jgi:outer membrane protein assembly factor BamB